MGRRALLTETERERLAGEGEAQLRYQAKSKVKSRIQTELPRDVEVLEEHHPELLEALRAVICPE